MEQGLEERYMNAVVELHKYDSITYLVEKLNEKIVEATRMADECKEYKYAQLKTKNIHKNTTKRLYLP